MLFELSLQVLLMPEFWALPLTRVPQEGRQKLARSEALKTQEDHMMLSIKEHPRLLGMETIPRRWDSQAELRRSTGFRRQESARTQKTLEIRRNT